MSTRARLRAIADRIQGFGVEAGKDATSLRALADRIDAEYETANDPIMGTDHGRLTRIALLNRLDAPVTPGEPGATCGTCKGTRTRYVSIGAFGEVVADQPCPDCAPSPPRSPEACPECRGPMPCSRTIRCRQVNAAALRSPEAPCEAWCGCTEDTWLAHHGTVMKARCVGAGQAMLYFCSQACFDAGLALNPRAAK
jgi:hypothetical protein